jgi:ferredoxin-NADP reductase
MWIQHAMGPGWVRRTPIRQGLQTTCLNVVSETTSAVRPTALSVGDPLAQPILEPVNSSQGRVMTHLDQLELHSGTLTTELREAEFDMVVEKREDTAKDVATLTLRAVHGAELPHWEPGAHIDLLVPGAGPRQYSLCGEPSDRRHWRIGVLNEPGGRGGSRYLHENLAAESRIRVRGPRNHFRLLPSNNYLFIAGGIGVTPILPMVAAADRAGAYWRMVYGGRDLSSMAFLDELATFGDRVTLWPQDEKALIDLPGLLGPAQADTMVYCCGPGPLLDAAEQRCAHWPPGSLHLERFVARPLTESARAEAFDVELRSSGITLTIPPERSILDVVEEAGVHVLSSCGEGTCGSCETPLLEGTPEHRDSVLNEEEQSANDCMMICVSRCLGERLVLDL